MHDLRIGLFDDGGSATWSALFNISGGGDVLVGNIAADGAGNVFFTGAVENGSNSFDALTVKFNPSGSAVWYKTHNGAANGYDGGADLVLDASGNVFITGVATTSAVSRDFLTIAYNSSGTALWSQLYDGAGLVDVAAKTGFSGGYLIVVGAEQNSINSWNMTAVRYNPSTGTEIGNATLSPNIVLNEINGFTTDANENIYIAGARFGTTTGYDALTIKLDSGLNILWEKTFDATGGEDVANAVAVDANGNVTVVGHATTPNGKDYMVLQYNPSGTLQWSDLRNGVANADDAATDVAVDENGDVYATGHINEIGNSDFYTVLYEQGGTEVWSGRFNNVYNREDKAAVIEIDGEGNLLVTGRATALDYQSIESVTTTTVKYVKRDIIIPPDEEDKSTAISYVANNGQLLGTDTASVPEIKFYTLGSYPRLYFSDDKLSMVLSQIDSDTLTLDTMHRVDIAFGYRPGGNIMALEEREDYLNFYLGHVPEGREQVSVFQRIVHVDAFPGIDVHYTSNATGVKYDFVIEPGVDPSIIELVFNGQTALSTNSNGELVVGTLLGDILLPQPKAYQINNGVEEELTWSSEFTVNGSSVTISVDTFDTNKPLILRSANEPQGLSIPCVLWSTYFGHGGQDIINAVDVNGQNGDIFTCGYTSSGEGFPVTPGVVQGVLNGLKDAFAFRFDPDGILEWGTYYGGGTSPGVANGDDKAYDIAVDALNNVYFVGATGSESFPKQQNPPAYYDGAFPPLSFFPRLSRSFIVKLSQSNGTRIWATHFGEHLSRNETISAVEVTANNHLVIGGYMQIPPEDYPNFPFETPSGAHFENAGNNFIAEFDVQNQIVWATLFNTGKQGSGENNPGNQIMDIAAGPSGNLFMTGSVVENSEVDFLTPNLEGGDIWDSHNGGAFDAFIAKFNTARTLTWATFFGGSSHDTGSSVACDPSGNLFVSGNTNSTDFPVKASGIVNGFDRSALHGGNDLFIAKFANNGTQLWTSYFGGTGDDDHDVLSVSGLDVCKLYAGSSLAVDGGGYVFVTGRTDSPDLPVSTTTCAPSCYYYPKLNQQETSGKSDAFLLVFTPELQKQFMTYWGGGQGDEGMGIATFGSANVIFVGSAVSTDPVIPLGKRVDDAYLELKPLGSDDGMIVELLISDIVMCEPVSIRESLNQGSGFLVYPVPMTDYIKVESKERLGGDHANLVIYDLLGQVVYRSKVERFSAGTPFMLDVGFLLPGSYFLTVSASGKMETVKLIKQ